MTEAPKLDSIDLKSIENYLSTPKEFSWISSNHDYYDYTGIDQNLISTYTNWLPNFPKSRNSIPTSEKISEIISKNKNNNSQKIDELLNYDHYDCTFLHSDGQSNKRKAGYWENGLCDKPQYIGVCKIDCSVLVGSEFYMYYQDYNFDASKINNVENNNNYDYDLRKHATSFQKEGTFPDIDVVLHQSNDNLLDKEEEKADKTENNNNLAILRSLDGETECLIPASEKTQIYNLDKLLTPIEMSKKIIENDCNIKNFLNSNPMNKNNFDNFFNDIVLHGCWGNRMDPFGIYSISSAPIDALDKLIQNWSKCHRCSKKSFCGSSDLVLESDYFTIDFSSSVNGWKCSDSVDDSPCQHNICNCNLQFSNDLLELITSFNNFTTEMIENFEFSGQNQQILPSLDSLDQKVAMENEFTGLVETAANENSNEELFTNLFDTILGDDSNLVTNPEITSTTENPSFEINVDSFFGFNSFESGRSKKQTDNQSKLKNSDHHKDLIIQEFNQFFGTGDSEHNNSPFFETQKLLNFPEIKKNANCDFERGFEVFEYNNDACCQDKTNLSWKVYHSGVRVCGYSDGGIYDYCQSVCDEETGLVVDIDVELETVS